MKTLAIVVAGSLLLGACATGGPDGGFANYDALRKMTADCTAKGGKLVQKSGDATYIGNYVCERP